jgi:hypothetical protein
MELHEKRFGKRFDHDERLRKKEARSSKVIAKKAQELHGMKGKLYAKERYKEKVNMKKKIKAHEEKEAQAKTEKKVEKKVEEKVEEKTTKAPKTDADIELFAKSVIEYVVLSKTTSGLKSYWVANQEQLDELKTKRPELYATVVDSFKAAKAALGE